MMIDAIHHPIRLKKVSVYVYRYPVSTPVRTSFGVMHDRPAIFVQIQSETGAIGWGEIWCNFPACGAEHRARLVESVIAPALLGKSFDSPKDIFSFLTKTTQILGLQSGEIGPLAQAIAGIDIAIWDLVGNELGLPLWKLFGGKSNQIKVYASGINPDKPEEIVKQRLSEGHRSFKLKIGFDIKKDIENIRNVKAIINDLPLMVDANQAWNLETAKSNIALLNNIDLDWIEEPIPVNYSEKDWRELSKTSKADLAGGENFCGEIDFENGISSKALGVIQPDIAKWGGFSGCIPVSQKILESNLRFCPHYLGAGVGLLASAHLLAAAGGDGKLEIDANENPLRSLTAGEVNIVHGGMVQLSNQPGLGVAINIAQLQPYLSYSNSKEAI